MPSFWLRANPFRCRDLEFASTSIVVDAETEMRASGAGRNTHVRHHITPRVTVRQIANVPPAGERPDDAIAPSISTIKCKHWTSLLYSLSPCCLAFCLSTVNTHTSLQTTTRTTLSVGGNIFWLARLLTPPCSAQLSCARTPPVTGGNHREERRYLVPPPPRAKVNLACIKAMLGRQGLTK